MITTAIAIKKCVILHTSLGGVQANGGKFTYNNYTHITVCRKQCLLSSKMAHSHRKVKRVVINVRVFKHF